VRFFTDALEARLHQELYVAILDSLLTERGSIQKLAKRANLSKVYLANIRNLELVPPKIPTPKTARYIAEALPAPPEVRQAALQHMVLAHEKRVEAHRVAKEEFRYQTLTDVQGELGHLLHQATFAVSPSAAHRHYRTVAETVSKALEEFAAEEDPLPFARLCLISHDVRSTLNRPHDALASAKRARFVVEDLDPKRHEFDRELADGVLINSIYAEAISLDSLGLYRDALACYDRIINAEVSERQQVYWKHAILRGKIRALSQVPRFSITEVEYLAEEGIEACYATSAEIAPLWNLLIAEALIRAYLRHDNYKDAERVMDQGLEALDKVPLIGPIHRTTMLQTFAQLRWAVKDMAGWRYFLTEARSLAIQAGLVRKIDQIEEEIRSRQRETRLDSGDKTTR
jgi:transcriptional regulator with XRE-family HTH domain